MAASTLRHSENPVSRTPFSQRTLCVVSSVAPLVLPALTSTPLNGDADPETGEEVESRPRAKERGMYEPVTMAEVSLAPPSAANAVQAGPARYCYCPPRRHTRFEPSFLELNGNHMTWRAASAGPWVQAAIAAAQGRQAAAPVGLGR